jgi:hypothetical protein
LATGTLGGAAAAGGVYGLGLAAQAGCSCIVTTRTADSTRARPADSRRDVRDVRDFTDDLRGSDADEGMTLRRQRADA